MIEPQLERYIDRKSGCQAVEKILVPLVIEATWQIIESRHDPKHPLRDAFYHNHFVRLTALEPSAFPAAHPALPSVELSLCSVFRQGRPGLLASSQSTIVILGARGFETRCAEFCSDWGTGHNGIALSARNSTILRKLQIVRTSGSGGRRIMRSRIRSVNTLYGREHRPSVRNEEELKRIVNSGRYTCEREENNQ